MRLVLAQELQDSTVALRVQLGILCTHLPEEVFVVPEAWDTSEPIREHNVRPPQPPQYLKSVDPTGYNRAWGQAAQDGGTGDKITPRGIPIPGPRCHSGVSCSAVFYEAKLLMGLGGELQRWFLRWLGQLSRNLGVSCSACFWGQNEGCNPPPTQTQIWDSNINRFVEAHTT